jgi:hypothetical protein
MKALIRNDSLATALFKWFYVHSTEQSVGFVSTRGWLGNRLDRFKSPTSR